MSPGHILLKLVMLLVVLGLVLTFIGVAAYKCGRVNEMRHPTSRPGRPPVHRVLSYGQIGDYDYTLCELDGHRYLVWSPTAGSRLSVSEIHEP